MKKLVCGVGVNDGEYKARAGGKISTEYAAWKNMLKRCFVDDHITRSVTYSGCTVSNNFKNYSFFYEWYQDQVKDKSMNFDLDKDLLFKNNKHYSEETCLLIPSYINVALTNRRNARGDYPVGVHYHKPLNKFRAQLNIYGKRVHIGYYEDIFSAFQAYKENRELYIKELAKKYRSSMDVRAYNALMSYVVDIGD